LAIPRPMPVLPPATTVTLSCSRLLIVKRSGQGTRPRGGAPGCHIETFQRPHVCQPEIRKCCPSDQALSLVTMWGSPGAHNGVVSVERGSVISTAKAGAIRRSTIARALSTRCKLVRQVGQLTDAAALPYAHTSVRYLSLRWKNELCTASRLRRPPTICATD
jgi:hypothetical protein